MSVTVDGYVDLLTSQSRFAIYGIPAGDKKRAESVLKAMRDEGTWHSMPMALWHYKDLLWQFPNLVMTGAAKQWLQSVYAQAEYMLHVKQQADIEDWQDKWFWAFPHQRVDAYVHVQAGRSFNWSDPGTGKTLSMIIAAVESESLTNRGHVVVVSPNSAKYNWRNEIRAAQSRIGEHYPIWVHTGGEKERNTALGMWAQKGGWLVINWEALRSLVERDAETRRVRKTKGKLLDLLSSKRIRMLIADESHKGKNRNAQQSECLYYLAKHADYLIEASGTPITAQPDDLWAGLNRAYPDKFTSYWYWVERYCAFQVDTFETRDGTGRSETESKRRIVGLNPETKDELNSILSTISVKRLFEDVAKDVPEKQYKVLPVDLTPEQMRLYKEAVENWMKIITNEYGENELLPIPNVISQITYLRQICLDPTIVGFHVKQVPAKTQLLLERLEDLNGKPLVHMSKFVKYIDRLELVMKAHKIPYIRITGKETPEQRQANVQRFQSGGAQIALCGIDASGVALTLTKASHMDFTDRDWTAALNTQAEGRIRRQGQKHPQLFSIYTAEGTVDDRIEQSVALKQSFDEAVVKGSARFTPKMLKELLRV